MELNMVQLAVMAGFIIIVTIAMFIVYIDGLKFKMRITEIDRDFYKNMYELEKEYAAIYKKFRHDVDSFEAGC